MSFFSEIAYARTSNKPTERKALPTGAYGYTSKDKNKPSFPAALLKIVKYLGAKVTRTDAELLQHSFLVASDGEEGTAFLQRSLKKLWLEPAAMALAFDRVPAAIAEGLTNEGEVEVVRGHFAETAKNKAIEANTPEDALEAAVAQTVDKIYTQIRINVGTLYRLIQCSGQDGVDARELDFNTLVHAQFAGEVVPGSTSTTADVKSVFKPRVN